MSGLNTFSRTPSASKKLGGRLAPVAGGLALRQPVHFGPRVCRTAGGGSRSRGKSSSWNKAWKEARLPTVKDYLKGVHNLRHTFGKRLRDAGVDERDVQDLLHHVPKSVTRHYSQPELRNLKSCLEKIVPKPALQAFG